MVKVGCCGFPGGKSKYFKQFKLVEVQETFYKLPKVETAFSWRDAAPSDFEFALKAWQLITHPPTSPTYRKAGIQVQRETLDKYGFLKPSEEVFNAWSRTKEIAETLKAKVVVVQMSPSFSCTRENVENMRSFFNSIDRKGIEIAWECRGDWLEKPEEIKKVVDELNLIHCVDILWDEPQSAHPISYIRLHGLERRYNYRYVYTRQDLQKLADKVLRLQQQKREVYVLFNNIAMRDSAELFKKVLKAISSSF